MSTLDKLLRMLEVERIDKYLFIGRSPSIPARVLIKITWRRRRCMLR